MEATMFTGWIYDFLKPYALELKVAHPAMLKAITAAKKKNDRVNAEKLAYLLRVSLLPECIMMSEELRKVTKNRGSFPNDESMLKLLYLALKNISKKWTMPIRNWKSAMNQFTIIFEDRMPTI